MAKPSRFIRDGHTDDLAELLGALEARIHTRDARKALINFAWLLLQKGSPRPDLPDTEHSPPPTSLDPLRFERLFKTCSLC
jgi:hypothetical protein